VAAHGLESGTWAYARRSTWAPTTAKLLGHELARRLSGKSLF